MNNKVLTVFLFLTCLGSSRLNWIDFVNENGESINTANTAGIELAGIELAANYGANAGGNGGGAKTLSCDYKKGISQICMTQGRKFIGKITLKCKDGSAAQSCGIANGDGRGSDVCYNVPSGGIRGVSAVTSKDGRYIKSVTLYAQNKSVLKTFSASDVSEAGPSIFAFGGVDTTKGELLGLQLRCGWWLDAVKAGFGTLSPGEDNVANSGSKSDFGSCSRGNDLRKWFNGPTSRGTGEKIVGSVYYRDQGWGNKKTDVFFCCNCSSSVQSASNCVSLCGTNVRGSYKKCEFNKNVPSSCAKGKSTCVAYRVGGGCGHRFYGKQFSAKLKYKQTAGMMTQIEDDDIIFEGEFVSDIIAFDDEEAEEQEEELSYLNYGVFGGAGIAFVGVVGAFATFIYKKRQENCELYENIIDTHV